MLYKCGHRGCDICGRRECSRWEVRLRQYGDNLACETCVNKSVDLARHVAETFGGCIIDLDERCDIHTKRGAHDG